MVLHGAPNPLPPPLLYCKFPCRHTNLGIKIQGGFNETQQHSRMCTEPHTAAPCLYQDWCPLQTVNNCIGRVEHREQAEVVGRELQCLRRTAHVPDSPASSSAHYYPPHRSMLSNQRDLSTAEKAGTERWGSGGGQGGWGGGNAIANLELLRMICFGAAGARPELPGGDVRAKRWGTVLSSP